MKIKYFGLIVGAALMTMSAFANIASTTYVDTLKDDVSESMKLKLDNQFKETKDQSKALVTDTDGKVVASTVTNGMIAAEAVSNNNVASGIGINKLQLPGNKCTGQASCILVYDGASGEFVWEVIGRASSGDVAPSTGGVDGAGLNN